MLRIKAYVRRRAWAAWHAGYPANFKDPKLSDLTGEGDRRPAEREQTPEQMLFHARLLNAQMKATLQ